MQTHIVIVSWSILDVWHLTDDKSIEPVLGGNPVLSGHYSITRGCPLNTGFTVLVSQNVFLLYFGFAS